MNKQILWLTMIGALVASLGMAGCSKQEQDNAKTATRDAVSKVRQEAREVGAEASKGMAQAKDAVAATAQDAAAAAKNATDKIADKVSDAVISAGVKAELAKDAELSALKISVDTENGRVALRGTAPSKSARERAMGLAAAVKGVVSVDNQLALEAGKP